MLLALVAAAVAGSAPVSTNPAVWERAIDYGRFVGGAMVLPHVRIELTVDENGDPIHCTILQSEEAKGFDGRYCALPMRRARFKPARDEEGRPIVGVISSNFQLGYSGHERGPEWLDYSLTVGNLPSPEPRSVTARVVTDAAGHVESCVVERSSGIVALDDAACHYTRSSLTLAAPSDRDGRTVRAMRLVHIGFAASSEAPARL